MYSIRLSEGGLALEQLVSVLNQVNLRNCAPPPQRDISEPLPYEYVGHASLSLKRYYVAWHEATDPFLREIVELLLFNELRLHYPEHVDHFARSCGVGMFFSGWDVLIWTNGVVQEASIGEPSEA